MKQEKQYMNKFEILNKLYLVEKLDDYSRFDVIKGNIQYSFHKHSTGEGINIHLIDGDKILNVYYNYNWFSSRYLFNEEGKKHGFLVDGPWVNIIEKQFVEWEKQLLEHDQSQKLKENLEKNKELAKKEKIVDYFTQKFIKDLV